MDKKRLFLSQPFLSITFKTFSFPFPRKTSFIQSQNPFKERVSPDLRQKQQRHNTFGTHLSLKKTTERERESPPPPPPCFSLYSTRSIGLVIFIWRQYSRRCTGISSFVPVIKLEISRFAGQRLCDSLFPRIFAEERRRSLEGDLQREPKCVEGGVTIVSGGYSPISPLNASLSLQQSTNNLHGNKERSDVMCYKKTDDLQLRLSRF